MTQRVKAVSSVSRSLLVELATLAAYRFRARADNRVNAVEDAVLEPNTTVRNQDFVALSNEHPERH